eukprot:221475-Chlamydomonas_euryale.AAC.16
MICILCLNVLGRQIQHGGWQALHTARMHASDRLNVVPEGHATHMPWRATLALTRNTCLDAQHMPRRATHPGWISVTREIYFALKLAATHTS